MINLKQYLFLLYAYVLQLFYKLFHSVEKLTPFIPKPIYGENQKKKFTKTFDVLSLTAANSNIDVEFYNKKELISILAEPNNELEKKWKTRILFENTPRGNVIMYYDAFKLGFAYYCDQHVPYDVLNKAAMKYVTTFQCRDFFIDETERPDDKPSQIMGLLVDEPPKEEKQKAKKTPLSDGPFAKLKSYNTVSGKVESNKKDEKSQPIKDKLRNSFINHGRVANFSFLQKPVKKPMGFKTDMLDSLFANSDVQKEVFNYRDFKAALAKAKEA